MALARRWRLRLPQLGSRLVASLALLSAAASVVAAVGESGGRPRKPAAEDDAQPHGAALEVLRGALVVALVLLSAIFSGLTLGFMSLDQVGLEVVIGAGERPDACREEQAKARAARRVLPVRRDGNLLLTTLVLGTVAVNSLMSILMADFTSGLAGFLISTVVIVLFGEIIPQSLCSRHALLISAHLVPVVRAVILLLYPFAKPISFALDYTLGKDVGTVFSRRELTQLLEIHARQRMLNPQEAHIVRGAMSFKHTKVTKVMVPSRQIFSLPISFQRIALTVDLLKQIYSRGFSRIPVWEKDENDIIGIIFTKDIVYVDPKANVPLREFAHVFSHAAHRIWGDSTLGEALRFFKTGSTHMALVYDVNNTGPGDPFYELKGLVTLQDVIEEILQTSLADENNSPHASTDRLMCAERMTLDYV